MKKMKQKNERGITLIALIITIIILVILAAVSIRAAYNSGIIDYGVNGTQKYQEEANKEESILSDTESFMKSILNKIGETSVTEIDEEIKSVSTREGAPISIRLSISGTRITTPPVPNGFYYVGGSIDDGYVISDNSSDAGKGVNAELVGNQFVFVPTDKNQKISLEVDAGENDIQSIKLYDPTGEVILTVTEAETTYQNSNIEPTYNGVYIAEVITKDSGDITVAAAKALGVQSLYANTINFITDEWVQYAGSSIGANWQSVEDAEDTISAAGDNITTYIGMIYEMNNLQEILDAHDTTGYDFTESVYNNGGFYVGRYEAGATTIRTEGNSSDTVSSIITSNGMPVSKANQTPYNYITRDQSKGLAESMYNSENFTCTLLTGSAWDRMLGFLTEAGTNNKTDSQVYYDSSSWGNYNNTTFSITNTNAKYSIDYGDSYTQVNGTYTKQMSSDVLFTTGATEINSAKNIYDLAGNIEEWTLRDSICEGNDRIYGRGGDFSDYTTVYNKPLSAYVYSWFYNNLFSRS